MASTLTLPEVIAIREFYLNSIHFIVPLENSQGSIPAGTPSAAEDYIWSPKVKIEIEAAKIDSKYVHIRFSFTNKYWAHSQTSEAWVVANSDHPEEDTSKPTCTLFEPVITGSQNWLYFRYVRTGGFVTVRSSALFVDVVRPNLPSSGFTFIDYGNLVQLPKHVAFKGYNDKYLKSVVFEGRQQLQFSSDDPDEEESGFEITTLKDGHIRIFSKYFKKFLLRTGNWVEANASEDTVDILASFWPVKVNESTIALQGARIHFKFCRSHSSGNRTDFLDENGATISKFARFRVVELALDTYVFRVRFHMESAHVYDEQAFLAGSGTAINNTQHENEFTVNISYEDTSTFSFGNSLALSSGVTTTFKTGIPRIAQAGIEVSSEVTKGFEWNRENTETKTVQASYTAVVPPMSIIRIDYVGTRGTCNIPFSYNQRIRRSTNGTIETTQHTDGVFTGVNYFDFHFEQPKIFSIADASKIMAGSNASKITAVSDASKSKITAAYASKIRARSNYPVADASKIRAAAESNYHVADASNLTGITTEAETNYPVAEASKITAEAESNE